ncbi:starch-binding domain-containing protein 1 [Hemicordylus capensis]|uniref:starch-binding domain-containing protein 1 n=1 Tax=Hemicordylus capensis TaxID=884348 RepID=UPI002302E8A9|nr:starch-binding domain-containing protein 1 [Hemicordylus capensis]
MAQGEEGDGGAQAPAQPPPPPPLPAAPLGAGGSGDTGPLAGLWPALLVALVAAFIAWLWYGSSDGKEEKAAAGASPPRGEQTEERETLLPAAKEPLQGNFECLVSEIKPMDVSSPQEPVANQLGPPGEHGAPDVPRESPEAEPVVQQPTTPLMNYKEYLSSEAFCQPATASEPPQSQEADTCGVDTLGETAAPWVQHEERCKEQLQHSSVDHEEWEMVPEHSAWGDGVGKSSAEDASKDLEQAKRVAAVSPMPQTVHVTFRVHYITHSEAQLVAITGDHECLGQWHHYVPLRCDKEGFWSDSVVLPVDTRVEWKFIVVENGKVRRWEECDNRTLMTEHEDRVAHKWWGYH